MVTKFTTSSLNPYSLAFIRFTWGAIGLGVVLIIKKQNFKLQKQDILPLALISILGQPIATIGLILGTRLVDSSTASLLVNTAPFWIFIILISSLIQIINKLIY